MAVIDAKVIALYVGRCCSPNGSPDVAKIAKELVPTVDAIISRYLGWSPSLATHTEYLPGEKATGRQLFGIDFGPGGMNGVTSVTGGRFPGSQGNQNPFVLLAGKPTRTITSVHINPNAWDAGTDGGDWPATTLQDVNSYALDFGRSGTPAMSKTGKLYLRFGAIFNIPRSIRVVYTSGYSASELENEFADITAAYGLTLAAWIAKTLSSRSVGSASNSGQVAGKPVSGVSVKDFSVTFASGMGAGQFGGGTGGNSGGAGGAIPDEAASLLLPHVGLAKYLNR